MKKVLLFFLINIIAAYGAVESRLFEKLSFGKNVEFLFGLLAFSILGLFSLELYKNRKNKI